MQPLIMKFIIIFILLSLLVALSIGATVDPSLEPEVEESDDANKIDVTSTPKTKLKSKVKSKDDDTKHMNPRSLELNQQSEGCSLMCPFEFCDSSIYAVVAERNHSMTNAVCYREPYYFVRQMMKTGEAKVRLVGSDKFVHISRLPVEGYPKGTFPTTFFQEKHTNEMSRTFLSGIGYDGDVPREAIAALDGACVSMPIGKWEDSDGNVNTRDRSCVSFTTYVAKVEVRLSWESNDDMDLVVSEPDGAVVDTEGKGVGLHIEDQGFAQCSEQEPNISGRTERIVYRENSKPLPGNYTVIPIMHNKCKPYKANKFTVKIVKDGIVIYDQTKYATTTLSDVTIPEGMATFTLP